MYDSPETKPHSSQISLLKAKLVGRLATRRFLRYSGRAREGLLAYPSDEKAILNNPVAQEIIANNGSTTFLVHATDLERAQRAMKYGLGIPRTFGHPDRPNLAWRTKMLAANNEPGALSRNSYCLAFRLERDGDEGGAAHYKIVAELPARNPGTSLKPDPFVGTHLERADGISIKTYEGVEPGPHGRRPFIIPPDRIRGVFDVETGSFTPNPLFVAITQHATLLPEPSTD